MELFGMIGVVPNLTLSNKLLHGKLMLKYHMDIGSLHSYY